MRYRGGWAGYAARSLVRAQNRRKKRGSSFLSYSSVDENSEQENSIFTKIIITIFIIFIIVLLCAVLYGFIWLCNSFGIFGFGIGIFIISLFYFLLG